ncbi:MAG: adenosylmethionine-8-amino-7-oxononanoate aminotransferase [Planctomycetota bacterium]
MSLIDRDLAAVWHPAAQMAEWRDHPPLVVERAEGSWLHLADGRMVLDGIGSWWCKILGHRHPRVLAALADQAARFDHHLLAGCTNEPVVRLAERWLAIANRPRDGWFARAFFADNGSTGVEVALKMALQWQAQAGAPGRARFAALEHAYHGETAGALSVTDLGRYRGPFAPMLSEPVLLRGLPLRTGIADPAWQDAAAAWPALQAQLDPHAGTLAAVIVEPVMQGAGGLRFHSPDLLRRLRGWCDANGVLLIADEIAAGCWRLGEPLACHHAGVLPDLAVLAKGLTAGALPFSMVLATARIYEGFLGTWASGRAFLHSNTFAGHALGVACAHAVLDEVEAADLPRRAVRAGERIRARLDRALGSRPWLGGLRGVGCTAAVDLLRRDGGAPDPALATGWRAARAATAAGVMLRPLGDTLYLMPPFTAADADLDAMVDGLVAGADAATA